MPYFQISEIYGFSPTVPQSRTTLNEWGFTDGKEGPGEEGINISGKSIVNLRIDVTHSRGNLGYTAVVTEFMPYVRVLVHIVQFFPKLFCR
jgi:hypothetical protein